MKINSVKGQFRSFYSTEHLLCYIQRVEFFRPRFHVYLRKFNLESPGKLKS